MSSTNTQHHPSRSPLPPPRRDPIADIRWLVELACFGALVAERGFRFDEQRFPKKPDQECPELERLARSGEGSHLQTWQAGALFFGCALPFEGKGPEDGLLHMSALSAQAPHGHWSGLMLLGARFVQHQIRLSGLRGANADARRQLLQKCWIDGWASVHGKVAACRTEFRRSLRVAWVEQVLSLPVFLAAGLSVATADLLAGYPPRVIHRTVKKGQPAYNSQALVCRRLAEKGHVVPPIRAATSRSSGQRSSEQ